MQEYEALVRRRQMLLERISKINYEIEKLDKRLDFLGRTNVSVQFNLYPIQESVLQEFS